jgi:molybdopterin synthase catalytic subunit
MSSSFALAPAPLDPAALTAALRALSGDAAGALVTFEGRVRAASGGRTVTGLEYEAYESLGCREGQRVADEAAKTFDVLDVACVHRTGALRPGEIAVWIGVTAAHRDAAFRACRAVIDEVKRRVPIWKKEHFADGTSEWSGTPSSPAAAARAPTSASG